MSDEIDTNVGEYNAGSTVRLTQQYTDSNGALANPTTVVLRVRPPDGVITTPTVTNPSTGNFESLFNVDDAGRWVYEWRTTGGNSVSIGEFDVLVSPMDDPLRGIIARQVRSLMPVTWEALKNADYYGESLLAERVGIAKALALPAALVGQDETVFTALMRDYIATLAAIEIIPAGIEYWMQQKIMVSATGTNESTSYTDRQAAFLKSLLPRLLAKAAQLAANPSVIALANSSYESPAISGNDDGQLITSDPYTFPEAFDIGTAATGGG